MTSSQLFTIRGMLGDMPKRFQNPRLLIRSDVPRPYYWIRVSLPGPDGKRRRVSRILGFVDDITKKEAMKLRAVQLDAANAGKIVVQAQIRFKHLVERFIEARMPQSEVSTQAWWQSLIDTHILPAFGEKQLADIDKQTVEAWLVGKEQAGLSYWTRKALRSTLSSIFKAAKDWNLWTGDSPAMGAWVGKKKLAREKRLLAVEDFRRLLAALPERPKFIVLIAFGLGLRISEILGLRWSDIDFDDQTIRIQRRWYRGHLSDDGINKTESSTATLNLSRSMMQELQSRFPGNQHAGKFIFIGDDGVMPPDEREILRYEFRPVLKRLGLYYKGFGWHAFKRMYSTWLTQFGGATPFEAQKASRHASIDMTYLYTLTERERMTAQQQRMFDKLMETPEGKPQ